jgi:hypothetical protein
VAKLVIEQSLIGKQITYQFEMRCKYLRSTGTDTSQEHNSDLTDEELGVSPASKENEVKVVQERCYLLSLSNGMEAK